MASAANEIHDEHKKMSQSGHKMGDKWNSMTAEKKAPYEKLAAESKLRCANETAAAYDLAHSKAPKQQTKRKRSKSRVEQPVVHDDDEELRSSVVAALEIPKVYIVVNEREGDIWLVTNSIPLAIDEALRLAGEQEEMPDFIKQKKPRTEWTEADIDVLDDLWREAPRIQIRECKNVVLC